MGGMKKDLLGKVFGRLSVLTKTDGRDNQGNILWNCLCSCGTEITVPSASLLRANTQSCGCLKKERFHNRKHGLSNHKLYAIWEAMIQRCYNPRNKKYDSYGGRGIEVCSEWRQNFQAFFEWSMQNRYPVGDKGQKLTIDRRDNDRGYSPDNCRWATYSVQNSNQRPRRR